MAGQLEDLENQAPITYLVKTVKGVRRNFIYYDPDIFEDKILLSASLLIGPDETPFTEHYNTAHDEDLGVSGTNSQALEDIAIEINPVPMKTSMRGPLRALESATVEYYFDPEYDQALNFIYDWYIDNGPGIFQSTSNATFLDGGKNVDVTFTGTGTVQMRCRISNNGGCYREIVRFLYPGILTKKMLVVRNSYC